ncbi:unnamed protein product [Larinioides sclopetarius]|uniref:RRM domain-containing protein n=1 Tax=Larinioides sclopetarius TaxID=280406 RepID=A0AAV2ALQ1_9ARAC
MGVRAKYSTNALPYINEGSLYAMAAFIHGNPNFSPYSVINLDTIVPIFNNLEPIIISHAVLTPPLPGRRRSRLTKPAGCRTVFVCNLPEKITEEIIKEAFKICGPISVVRMSKKNFCSIMFVNTESVDQAVLLSDFRIRIDEREDPAYNGTFRVDYAVARDDNHDYKCLLRTRVNEERRRRLREALRSPPIPHFSLHVA